jgi:hypothetical protein
MEKFQLFEPVEVGGDSTILTQLGTTLGLKKPRKRRNVDLSTPESVAPTKKKTCNDRSKTSRTVTPITSSSRTSVLASISEEKACRPSYIKMRVGVVNIIKGFLCGRKNCRYNTSTPNNIR